MANAVADAMKDWAVENGATHFTHWFQPLTGITAEKHDSFITPAPDGRVLMEFSGKELIRGEPDASSFPSGGLRATFEARGYTAWDPTSYAFIKGKTLCIPTAFCSYGGRRWIRKTPSSAQYGGAELSGPPGTEAVRQRRGQTCDPLCRSRAGIFPDRQRLYEQQRKDLIYTGRTLFGAKPKGGRSWTITTDSISPRVAAFMGEELNH